MENSQENEPTNQKTSAAEAEVRAEVDSQKPRGEDVDKLSFLKNEYKKLERLGYPTASDDNRAAEIEKDIKTLEASKKGKQEGVKQDDRSVVSENETPAVTDPIDRSVVSENETPAVTDLMNEKNRQTFDVLSPKAKGWAARAFSLIYKETGLERLAAGLAIEKSQRIIDANEKKMVGRKKAIDEIDARIREQGEYKKEINSLMARYEEGGIPVPVNFALDIIKTGREEERLKKERDETQREFEEKKENAKTWATKRNEIAERMIGVYNEKLAPMEKELSGLEGEKDRLEFSGSVMESRHSRQLEIIEKKEKTLEEILERKERIKKSFSKKAGGVFEEDTSLEISKKDIEKGREGIKRERDYFRQEKTRIEELMANANAKAKPHRNAKASLVGVQSREPLEIILEKREKEKKAREAKAVKIEPRGESLKKESAERFNAASLVGDWNNYVKGEQNEFILKEEDFFIELKRDEMLKTDEFRNIVKKYAKMKAISLDKFDDLMSEFIKNHQK